MLVLNMRPGSQRAADCCGEASDWVEVVVLVMEGGLHNGWMNTRCTAAARRPVPAPRPWGGEDGPVCTGSDRTMTLLIQDRPRRPAQLHKKT